MIDDLDTAILEMMLTEGVLSDLDEAVSVAAACGNVEEFDTLCDLADNARNWVHNAYVCYLARAKEYHNGF